MAYVYVEGGKASTSVELEEIGTMLAALGYLDASRISNTYMAYYSDAVKNYQRDYGYTVDGVLTTGLIEAIRITYQGLGRSRAVSTTSNVVNSSSSDERTDTFFHSGKKLTTRRNNQDIKIVIGEQKQKQKTLKNVYFRSVGIVVDASGNPVAEQYEFIAKDLIES